MKQALTKFGFVVLAALTLSACTAVHTPDPYLPSRSSIAPGETITVSGGQNVYAVARQYKVSMRDIIVLNNLPAPYVLKSGQRLVLPAAGSGSYAASGYGSYSYGSAPQPNAAPSGVVESAPLSPPVQSAPVGVSPSSPSYSSSAVQAVELPPPTLPPAAAPKPVPQPGAVEALNAPSHPAKPVETTVATVAKPEVVAAPSVAPVATAAPTSIASTAASASASSAESENTPAPVAMVWPVQGPVLSGFGPKGQGLNNDGVNIGAPKGAPVVAAANGIVVYAGTEMKGFGKLILIRHQGGWVTAYAHLDRMLVSKDAVVAQGDMIGTVGKSGSVATPQLHFEIRQKDKPVDPKSIIKS